MGQKVYTVPIENVTIGTAVQDIYSLVTGASNGIEIHHIHLDANVAAEASLRMRLKRGTAVTQGSGGSSVTPAPCDATDPVSVGVTAHINDTTQATGSFTTLAGFFWDVALPFDDLPAPEDRFSCTVLQGLFLDLPATVTATTISGFLKYRLLP